MGKFSVGSLVSSRGREWIVLPSLDEDLLMLRPLGGSEAEECGIYLPIEEQPSEAKFPLPVAEQFGDLSAGALLRDAARFTLRSGAGPFRSFARLNIRPRPYQLVPLIMALRQADPVRLLIADDVGVGKTIEAGLIAREFLDRGEIRRLTVICPPHLCEQWQRELLQKFSIDAKIVSSATINELERNLPHPSISVYEHYEFTITSIDYVKSDRRRSGFLQSCPEFVIVDEAHTATRSVQNTQQQRYQLLHDLATDQKRHMLLLTATPHSGIESSFLSLLGLLRSEFAHYNLTDMTEPQKRKLAQYFVQRRRGDVQKWLGEDDITPFPKRLAREEFYQLPKTGDYRQLYNDIYKYTKELIQPSGMSRQIQRARYWAALALLRCVMSSPAAAELALRSRAKQQHTTELADADPDTLFREQLYEEGEGEQASDFDPSQAIDYAQLSSERLLNFARRAAALKGKNDPKLEKLIVLVKQLLDQGYNPIIYCHYIATAKYLAEELRGKLKVANLQIVDVTGERSEDERERLVEELALSPRRVLVATDCMSEGINLQHSFDAVVHYDLPWNPNRLEQREGRIDRYGQPRPEVSAILYYGQYNPIDEAVMKVLLRKAREIHRALGISVPLPQEHGEILEQMIQEIYADPDLPIQTNMFDEYQFADSDNSKRVEQLWQQAEDREKASRTRYAQHAIRADEVEKELREVDDVLGNPKELENFVRQACERVGIQLQKQGDYWQLLYLKDTLPAILDEQIKVLLPKRQAKTLTSLLLSFDPNKPLPADVALIGRNHPLVAALAEYVLEQANNPEGNHFIGARCGMIRTSSVSKVTKVLLLRVRLLVEHKQGTNLAEEVLLFTETPQGLQRSEETLALLTEVKAAQNSSQHEIVQAVSTHLSKVDIHKYDHIAEDRAEHLRKTYQRLAANLHSGKVKVSAHTPVDLLGFYLLMPVLAD